MDVKLCSVKATKVVDARTHVFQREVHLEEQALVALNGVGSGVSLGEGVAGEAFHLTPNLFDNMGGVTLVHGLGMEGIPRAVKRFAGPKLAAHSTPQHVGFTQVQPCKFVRDLDHIFLVHHHPVGLGHQFHQRGMGILPLVEVAVPLDVRLHHAASGHARSNDRACCHQP